MLSCLKYTVKEESELVGDESKHHDHNRKD